MEGQRDEYAAECQGGHHRHVGDAADTQALDRLGIKHGSHKRLALARLRVREIVASRFNIGLKVRLFP
ncbi:hypothetical protein D3C71_1863990 [compost metagenome]